MISSLELFLETDEIPSVIINKNNEIDFINGAFLKFAKFEKSIIGMHMEILFQYLSDMSLLEDSVKISNIINPILEAKNDKNKKYEISYNLVDFRRYKLSASFIDDNILLRWIDETKEIYFLQKEREQINERTRLISMLEIGAMIIDDSGLISAINTKFLEYLNLENAPNNRQELIDTLEKTAFSNNVNYRKIFTQRIEAQETLVIDGISYYLSIKPFAWNLSLVMIVKKDTNTEDIIQKNAILLKENWEKSLFINLAPFIDNIATMASVLKSGNVGNFSDRAKSYIEKILEDSEKIQAISYSAKGMLDLADIKSEELQQVTVSTTLIQIIDSIKPILDNKKIKIFSDIPVLKPINTMPNLFYNMVFLIIRYMLEQNKNGNMLEIILNDKGVVIKDNSKLPLLSATDVEYRLDIRYILNAVKILGFTYKIVSANAFKRSITILF